VTLIDSEMAAVLLGVSVRRVRQMVDEGKITNHGDPRSFAFDLDAISRLAEQKQRRDLTN
jgi:phage terminase Nu1 subunit (DNA packaging protein)